MIGITPLTLAIMLLQIYLAADTVRPSSQKEGPVIFDRQPAQHPAYATERDLRW